MLPHFSLVSFFLLILHNIGLCPNEDKIFFMLFFILDDVLLNDSKKDAPPKGTLRSIADTSGNGTSIMLLN